MSDDLQDYLKSLNPKPEEQAILIYGSKYRLYREGKFLCEAVWTEDENVGDSFQIRDGKKIEVVTAMDRWELIIEEEK